MNKNGFKAISSFGYQKTTEPKNSKLEGDSLSLHPTTQKGNSFVKLCVQNKSSDVSDEHRRELINCTTSGYIFVNIFSII